MGTSNCDEALCYRLWDVRRSYVHGRQAPSDASVVRCASKAPPPRTHAPTTPRMHVARQPIGGHKRCVARSPQRLKGGAVSAALDLVLFHHRGGCARMFLLYQTFSLHLFIVCCRLEPELAVICCNPNLEAVCPKPVPEPRTVATFLFFSDKQEKTQTWSAG